MTTTTQQIGTRQLAILRDVAFRTKREQEQKATGGCYIRYTSTASRVLQSLEKRGLIERTGVAGGKTVFGVLHWRHYWTITEEGQAIVDSSWLVDTDPKPTGTAPVNKLERMDESQLDDDHQLYIQVYGRYAGSRYASIVFMPGLTVDDDKLVVRYQKRRDAVRFFRHPNGDVYLSMGTKSLTVWRGTSTDRFLRNYRPVTEAQFKLIEQERERIQAQNEKPWTERYYESVARVVEMALDFQS